MSLNSTVAAPNTLPPQWSYRYDPLVALHYYFNSETGVSTYDAPCEVRHTARRSSSLMNILRRRDSDPESVPCQRSQSVLTKLTTSLFKRKPQPPSPTSSFNESGLSPSSVAPQPRPWDDEYLFDSNMAERNFAGTSDLFAQSSRHSESSLVPHMPTLVLDTDGDYEFEGSIFSEEESIYSFSAEDMYTRTVLATTSPIDLQDKEIERRELRMQILQEMDI